MEASQYTGMILRRKGKEYEAKPETGAGGCRWNKGLAGRINEGTALIKPRERKK